MVPTRSWKERWGVVAAPEELVWGAVHEGLGEGGDVGEAGFGAEAVDAGEFGPAAVGAVGDQVQELLEAGLRRA